MVWNAYVVRSSMPRITMVVIIMGMAIRIARMRVTSGGTLAAVAAIVIAPIAEVIQQTATEKGLLA
jgi:hypothetical protein